MKSEYKYIEHHTGQKMKWYEKLELMLWKKLRLL